MTDTTAPRPLWTPDSAEMARRVEVAARRAPTTSSAESLVDRAVAWPLRRPARAARSSLTAIGVVVAAIRLPAVVEGEWSNFREVLSFEVATVAWVLLVTMVVRTITPRHVISFWLLGIFFAGTLVDGLGTVIAERVAGNAFEAGVVPVLEETVKLLPIVLFAIVTSRAGRGVGAVDCCVLGLAVGGGFAIYEDMLWGRSFVSGFEGIGVALPTVLQDPLFAAGHMVWTGCTALGIGLLVLHRRRRWAWAVAPIFLVVPYVDHAVVNYRGGEWESMRSMLLEGRVTPWLLLGGLVIALGTEVQIVSRSRRVDHLFAPATATVMLTSMPPPAFSPRTSPRQLQRARNEVVYRHHVGGEMSPRLVLEVAATAAALGRAAPAPPGPAGHP